MDKNKFEELINSNKESEHLEFKRAIWKNFLKSLVVMFQNLP